MMRQDLSREDESPSDIEREVRKRVKKIKDFYTTLAVFVVLTVLLIIINLLTTPGTFWAIWPLLGFSAVLALYAIVEGLVPFGIGSKSWEERKVRALMLQQQRGLSAEQVRHLLREELHTEQYAQPSPAEWERMRQRLENLEAIVTSKDWDEVASEPDHVASPDMIAEEEAEEEDPANQAAHLARRVR